MGTTWKNHRLSLRVFRSKTPGAKDSRRDDGKDGGELGGVQVCVFGDQELVLLGDFGIFGLNWAFVGSWCLEFLKRILEESG